MNMNSVKPFIHYSIFRESKTDAEFGIVGLDEQQVCRVIVDGGALIVMLVEPQKVQTGS